MDQDLIAPPRLVIPDTPRDEDRAAILAGLAAFNRDHAAPGSTGALAVLLADDAGRTIGGLWGRTLFSWLQIELLFVPEQQRGQAVGSAVLRRAEALALARGCIGASLDTYSFQARGFYEKLGYSLVGTITDCPPGGARHFLHKRFAPA
ncbi:GNAT family N-acetyltransferase [Sphingomonas qilianensis]|uniref:GNAT family N-acetyltransferase n=1 Tax=Sphingomonas qilianensis TaxID=1736690 RepID=A0ABU9XTS4_9SPHN